MPSKDGKTWVPRCATRFNPEDKAHEPGYEVLCRKTIGFVDLPDMVDGKPTNGKIDANNLYFEHKKKWAVEHLALEDGRRDLGEENGITCAQCHIRNFGMRIADDPFQNRRSTVREHQPRGGRAARIFSSNSLQIRWARMLRPANALPASLNACATSSGRAPFHTHRRDRALVFEGFPGSPGSLISRRNAVTRSLSIPHEADFRGCSLQPPEVLPSQLRSSRRPRCRRDRVHGSSRRAAPGVRQPDPRQYQAASVHCGMFVK